METHTTSSYWLGLASYEEKDAPIFYGRDAEIETLADAIFHNTQTIIYGPSGTGKTSIIRAGIFKKARDNNYFPVYIRLNHESREAYGLQIIREIETSALREGIEIENRMAYIDPATLSLWEFFHCNIFWNKHDFPVTPLLVVDQFEEIFTLAKSKEEVSAFFVQLSDLCDDKFPSYVRSYLSEGAGRIQYPEKINYRCILSLREDFLARLEECADDIPALKRNRYSLQALNGRQALDIIIKPSQGTVSEEVALEIIRKVTNSPHTAAADLPMLVVEPSLLSLFCNVLDGKRRQNGQPIISISLVREFGDNIIKDFYRSVMAQVSAPTVSYLENSLLTGDGFRDNVALKDAFQQGVTKKELDFLQKNRLIRIEEWDGTKRLEFTHDVLCKVALECREKREEDQRLEREQQHIVALKRRNRNIICLSLLIILLLGGGIVGYFYAYEWKYTEYYESIVWRYEFPYGINRLSSREIKHRDLFFELTRNGYLGKHWTGMRALNSSMNPVTGNNLTGTLLVNANGDQGADEKLIKALAECCLWEFITDADDRMVIQSKVYNRKKELIYCFSLTDNHFEKDTLRYALGQYTDAKGFPIRSRKNGASNVKITFDAKGFRHFIEYFDAWGNRVTNYDLAYAQKWEYNNHPDSLGLLKRYGSANAQGEYVFDKTGNSGMIELYERIGGKWKNKKTISVDPQGQPCSHREGYAAVEYAYDREGRPVKIAFFDEEGKPLLRKEDQSLFYHFVTRDYDERGNVIKTSFYGLDGRLTEQGEAYRICTYDLRTGLIARVMYYDHKGEAFWRDGMAGWENEYEDADDPFLCTAYITLGADGEPCIGSDNVYVTRYQYDAAGNRISERNYEKDGVTPRLNRNGLAGIDYRYNEEGQLVEKIYLDKENQLSPSYGYARTVYQYDENGNETKETYYGTDGEKYVIPEGYSSIVSDYDGFRNLIKKRYQLPDGTNASTRVVCMYTYDFWGNETEMILYDEDETTNTSNTEGWHRRVQAYDSLFFIREISYYDINDQPMNAPDESYAVERRENDKYGNILSRTYFDKEGKPCQCTAGYHQILFTYDTKGNKIREKYRDTAGNPTTSIWDIYQQKQEYDYNGRLKRVISLDLEANPANNIGGYAILTYGYDVYGNQIEESYYDKDDRPVAAWENYHKRVFVYEGSLLKREEYYGADGQLLPKASIKEYGYNNFNDLVSVAYYNASGPDLGTEGWHKQETVYDLQNHRILGENYYGTDLKTKDCRHENGLYCKVRYVYDENAKKIAEWHYKAKGDSTYIGPKKWQGTKRYESGSYYVGMFSDEVREGYGTYYAANGVVIEGEWKDGSLHGQGKYIWPDGGYYEGEFRRGDFYGMGTKYGADGHILETGFYVKDEFQGYVLFTVDSVQTEMPAAQTDIQKGDIILRLDQFNYFENNEQWHPIQQLIATRDRLVAEDREKILWLARKSDTTYVYHTYTFPAGKAGIVVRNSLVDRKELDRLYQSYIQHTQPSTTPAYE